MKKFVSLILTLVMCMAIVPYSTITSTAASTPEITISDAVINEGDSTATFDISISNNTGFWCLQGFFTYNNEMRISGYTCLKTAFTSFDISDATLTTIRDNTIDYYSTCNQFKNIKTYYSNAGISYSNKLASLVYLEQKNTSNYTGNAVVASVTLDTSKLKGGEYDIDFVVNPSNTINENFKTVAFTVNGGKLTVNHDMTTTVYNPTCIVDGYTLHKCSKCSYSYTDNYVTAPGHTWDDGTVTVKATYAQNGEMTYKCTLCTAEKTEVIPYLQSKAGDISRDGRLTSRDVNLFKMYTAGKTTLTAIQIAACDVNGDNRVNARDLNYLRQLLSGKIQ